MAEFTYEKEFQIFQKLLGVLQKHFGNNFAVTSFWVSSNRKSEWSCTVNCPISHYLKLSYGYSTHAKARKYSLECGGETYEGNSLDELVSEYMKKVLANLKKQLSVLESVKKAGK